MRNKDKYKEYESTVEELEECTNIVDRSINAKLSVPFLRYNDLKEGLQDLYIEGDTFRDIYRRQRIARGLLFDRLGFRFYNLYRDYSLVREAINLLLVDHEGNILLDEQKYLLEKDKELRDTLKNRHIWDMIFKETNKSNYLIVPIKDVNSRDAFVRCLKIIMEQKEDFFLDSATKKPMYIALPASSEIVRETAIPAFRKAKINHVCFWGEK